MNRYTETISNIKQEEIKLGLYKYELLHIPIWKVLRSPVVEKYLNKEFGFGKRDTTEKKIHLFKIIGSYIKSLWGIIILFLSNSKNIDYLFMAFPRLQKFDGKYIDKFTDPLTGYLPDKTKWLIFQRPLAGVHKKPRYNSEKVFTTDFIEFTSKVMGIIFSPFIALFIFNTTFKIYQSSKSHFKLSSIDFLKFNINIGQFLISYFFYKLVLLKLKPKKIFLVNRGINQEVIANSHKLNIETFELQHGVTFGPTILYSGLYDECLDPDYFLTFGKYWRGSHFGVPSEKIINIGWCYGSCLQEKYLHNKLNKKNKVLVISEPLFSEKIVSAIIKIAVKYKEFAYDLRLHPQEKLSKISEQKISKCSNVKIIENDIESTINVLSYDNVVGVNSSVLYEALSLGKNVGKIAFDGCEQLILNEITESSFYMIRAIDDFPKFINVEKNQNNCNQLYSLFDKKKFNEILFTPV